MPKQIQEKLIKIPRSLTQGESLVVIPQKIYEEFLKWRRQLNWEEKDTDKAVAIFKREYSQSKLKRLESLKDLR